MTPRLCGIDHAHVYVSDRNAAVEWYGSVLGFRRLAKFDVWATEKGPVTLEDADGTVHLALFEDAEHPPVTSLAFGTTGAGFLAWKAHLEGHALPLRIADHDLAWSLYFHDPWGNYHEITTYDHEQVAAELGTG